MSKYWIKMMKYNKSQKQNCMKLNMKKKIMNRLMRFY